MQEKEVATPVPDGLMTIDELAREAPCDTRFLRMNYADGLELLEQIPDLDLVVIPVGGAA